ncbi:MAG: hypothetical protein QXM12_03155 [Nitrososphaerota archaeon]
MSLQSLFESRLSTYSIAGLLIFGIFIMLFIGIYSEFISHTMLSVMNATSLISNGSTPYTIGNTTVHIGKPSNQFLRSVVDSVSWLFVGLINIIRDPVLLALVVVSSLIIVVVSRTT